MKEISYYTKHLEEERDKLAIELDKLGVSAPDKPGDWDVRMPEMDTMTADENELADRAEELHIGSIVLDELEMQHRSVVHALEKTQTGTYGTCEVCSGVVEEDRLDANPAARTCKAHMGDEGKLEAL